MEGCQMDGYFCGVFDKEHFDRGPQCWQQPSLYAQLGILEWGVATEVSLCYTVWIQHSTGRVRIAFNPTLQQSKSWAFLNYCGNG